MTTAIEEKETMSEMPQVGKIVKESDYGCQILQEKTTLEKANDRSLPTDAKLIWYVVDGIEYIDLTRCGKTSKLFDMYYDKYGPGSVQKIDFGYGSVNPSPGDTNHRKKKEKIKCNVSYKTTCIYTL